ncbi:MAG: tetratricopeptide repeat protein [Betaproteobacteria bacterium]
MDEAIQRAIELRNASQHTEALTILLDLNNANPDDAIVNYELASTFSAEGVREEAIGFYERAIECGLEGDELRRTFASLGSNYLAVGRIGDAARILQRGAAIFPDAPEFDIFLAMTRYHLGEYQEAVRLLSNHVAQYTSDPATQTHSRAISYCAEHLDQIEER